MATEAPSWADQWGAGGIGAVGEDDHTSAANKGAGKANKNPTSGLGNKVKSIATAGAQKLKNGTSSSFKWVKNKCQKRNSSP